MNEQDYINYWSEVRGKIDKFKKLDVNNIIFGAGTKGMGHNYEILPKVSNSEILNFERENGISFQLIIELIFKF